MYYPDFAAQCRHCRLYWIFTKTNRPHFSIHEIPADGSGREPPHGRDETVSSLANAVEPGSISVFDPWNTEEIWRPWNICMTTTEPGRYGFHRRFLRTLDVALY
jgi:hypothetical protein